MIIRTRGNWVEIERIVRQRSPLSLNLNAGDVLVMHPLTVHSSNKSINYNPRRVLHLEYSSGDLPPELSWHKNSDSDRL